MGRQAKETWYKGYHFRSRTEARWAMLFDNLGIEWVYEPEGYRVGVYSYLPDFYLPKRKTYLEIKPHDEARIESDLDRWTAFREKSDAPLIVLIGSPETTYFEAMLFLRQQDRTIVSVHLKQATLLPYQGILYLAELGISEVHGFPFYWTNLTRKNILDAIYKVRNWRFDDHIARDSY